MGDGKYNKTAAPSSCTSLSCIAQRGMPRELWTCPVSPVGNDTADGLAQPNDVTRRCRWQDEENDATGRPNGCRESNEGVRKICGCPRRVWPKCRHPWHFSFQAEGVNFRFSLDRYARQPMNGKTEAEARRTASSRYSCRHVSCCGKRRRSRGRPAHSGEHTSRDVSGAFSITWRSDRSRAADEGAAFVQSVC